jgi:hypothetical protein
MKQPDEVRVKTPGAKKKSRKSGKVK